MTWQSNLALDFASFLLRYDKDLDYGDFSDDGKTISRIRREESFRQWADIEDLATNVETLFSSFEGHKNTAANAFKEIFHHLDTFKKDILSKFGDQTKSFHTL